MNDALLHSEAIVHEHKVLYVDGISGERECFTTFSASQFEALASLRRWWRASRIVRVWSEPLVPSELEDSCICMNPPLDGP